MEKRGLSGVIVTVLLVGFSIVLAGIVWAVVRGLVEEQLGSAQPCLNTFGKVSVNGLYTCYDATNAKTHFSISVENLDVEQVVVVISSAGSSSSYRITNNLETITGLGPYPSGVGQVKLPGKNGGSTYIASGFSSPPDEIKLAPVIDGQQCEVSDTLYDIENCLPQ